jgi:hypothetical protein
MENKKPILFMFTNYGLLNLYICVLDKLNISQYLVQLQETELLQMNLFLIMLLIIGFSQLKQIFEIIEKPFHILKITYNRDLEKEKDSVKSYFTEILEEILMTIAMVITITSTINATAKIAILIFFLLFIKNDWKNVFQSCSST